jgi:hypothetical protein
MTLLITMWNERALRSVNQKRIRYILSFSFFPPFYRFDSLSLSGH